MLQIARQCISFPQIQDQERELSCTEGDEVGSPSGRALRVRGAGVDSGDHPWGNRHGVRASNAVGRLREKVGK